MLQQAININGSIMHSNVVTPEILNTINQLADFSGSTIWLIDDTGQIIATSSEEEVYLGELINDELIADTLQGKNSIEIMQIDEEERPMLSVVVPWGSNEEIHGGIILHSPISGINSTVRNIREIVLWAIIGGLVIVSILVSYLSFV